MSAGPTTSAACATMGAGCAMATAPAAADRRGGAFGRDPAGARGGGAVRLEAVPALDEAASHPAPGGDGRGSVRSRALDARRRGALRGGGARQALEVDRVEDLSGAPRALRGLQAPRPLPAEARGAVPRCALPCPQTQGPEGGRPLRLGLHRGRGAGPGRGLPRDARVARGLARPRPRPDRPRAWGADADRRRRRPWADQGGRAVLAGLRPPALLRSPGAEPDREAARSRARARAQGLLGRAR